MHIEAGLIEDHSETLMLLFSKIIPVRVEHRYDRQEFEIAFVSPHIPVTGLGCLAPTYRPVFTRHEDNSLSVDINNPVDDIFERTLEECDIP